MAGHHKWPVRSVSDVCEQIIDCINKTAPSVDYETPYKMIRTTNVRDGWVDLSDVRYVTEEIFETWTRRGRPRKGDVILTREAPLGEVGLLRSDETVFLGQRLVMYRADPEKLDNRFLLYSFLTHEMKGQIQALGSGATVAHMRVPDCEKLTLPVPPLETQRQIADILSAYDDLIENNTRRIQILEELARTIYREWFVHFRYPGHATTPLVDSPIGPVPEGWEVVRFSDAIEVQPRVRVPREGEKPYIPMGSLSTDSMIIHPIEERSGNSGAKFQNGDTLMARITPSLENGKTSYVQFLPTADSVAFGSTEFIVLRSKALCPEMVYLLARTEEVRSHAIKSMTGASGRQRVQESCFDDFLLATPSSDQVDQFQRIAKPIFEVIHRHSERNLALRRVRDLLLPRLISGQISLTQPEMIAAN